MAVLSDFQPMGAPGQTGRSYMEARGQAESWMDRAQRREINREELDTRRQLNAILMPVKAAQARADLVKAKTELDGAVQTQGARQSSYALLDQARQDFDFINSVPNADVRANMSREWLSRYSQLQNVAELSDEMKTKNNLATSNIMDAMKLSYLSTELQTFNGLTEGFTPEEKMNARKVKTGLKGRASGAAIQYKEVVGPDGSKRLVAVDPRSVGAQVVDSGESFGSGVNETPESVAFESGQQPRSRSLTGQTAQEEALAKERGKLAAEKVAAMPRRKAAVEKIDTTTDRLMEDIDTAISQVSTLTAGPGGTLLAVFPGTSARDLQATLDTIKANVGFEALQAMRDASKTGGALGSITERELDLLQATLANFQVGQSPKQLIENLKKARRRIAENAGAARRAFESEYEDVPEYEKANRRFNDGQKSDSSGSAKEVGKYKVRIVE